MFTYSVFISFKIETSVQSFMFSLSECWYQRYRYATCRITTFSDARFKKKYVISAKFMSIYYQNMKYNERDTETPIMSDQSPIMYTVVSTEYLPRPKVEWSRPPCVGTMGS